MGSVEGAASDAEYQVSVTETREEDYSIDNNQKTVTLGAADVAIQAEYEQIGSSKTVVAEVTNHGIAPASGKVSFLDAAGAALSEVCYEDLKTWDTELFYWDLDEDKLGYCFVPAATAGKHSFPTMQRPSICPDVRSPQRSNL